MLVTVGLIDAEAGSGIGDPAYDGLRVIRFGLSPNLCPGNDNESVSGEVQMQRREFCIITLLCISSCELDDYLCTCASSHVVVTVECVKSPIGCARPFQITHKYTFRP